MKRVKESEVAFVKAAREYIEAFMNDCLDQECPYCNRLLDLPDSEQIETWLKGEN